ncbi:MliC family protein [Ideonella sp.]|uniref:MliC family protein n=1 Tax=Ideonella sp. TaxID=1929293 RepID=UPI002B461262|nr:MliC family protein [Ideonella sp.]HJV72332.1 MliC family protein [Ideonella sp.]HSN34230.1 MliC family protein [Ideonella sp.]
MPLLKRPRLAAGLALALASVAAYASPADYQCEDGGTLTADFSPRAAQVRYEGQHWTLQRVREAREARYVSRAGVSITLLKNQATLERKGQPSLACKLVVRALRPEALGVAPAAADSAAQR